MSNLLDHHPGTYNLLTCKASLHVAQVSFLLSAMASGVPRESTVQKCLSFLSIPYIICLQLSIILPIGGGFSVTCEERSIFISLGACLFSAFHVSPVLFCLSLLLNHGLRGQFVTKQKEVKEI